MDNVRVGRSLRALRLRRAWRQVDLAREARLSQSTISRVELGDGDRLTIRELERIAAALAARVDVRLSRRGEGLDRLLDDRHAALVERIVFLLRSWGWEVAPEASFSIRGEHGSIDVLAWWPASAGLLVVEVKSAIGHVQMTLSGPLGTAVRAVAGVRS